MKKIPSGKFRHIRTGRQVAEAIIEIFFDDNLQEVEYHDLVKRLQNKKYLNLSKREANMEYLEDGRLRNIFENDVRNARDALSNCGILKPVEKRGIYRLESKNRDELLETISSYYTVKERGELKDKIWYINLDAIILNYLSISTVPLTIKEITDDVANFVDFSDRDASLCVRGRVLDHLLPDKKLIKVSTIKYDVK